METSTILPRISHSRESASTLAPQSERLGQGYHEPLPVAPKLAAHNPAQLRKMLLQAIANDPSASEDNREAASHDLFCEFSETCLSSYDYSS